MVPERMNSSDSNLGVFDDFWCWMLDAWLMVHGSKLMAHGSHRDHVDRSTIPNRFAIISDRFLFVFNSVALVDAADGID